jgi:hypothetical protein
MSTGLVLSALVTCWLGCDDKRRHQTSEAIEFEAVQAPVPDNADAPAVARAFLEALRDAQHARSQDFQDPQDRAKYDSAMGRIASLAAKQAIYVQVVSSGLRSVPADLTVEAAVTMISESWVSIAAYYVDGFMFETTTLLPGAGASRETTVRARLIAEPPADRTRLTLIETSDDVLNARDADGKPLDEDSSAYTELVRSRSLEMKPSFNIPIGVWFEITLRQVDGPWRVSSLRLRPGPARLPATSAPFAIE